MKKNYRMDKKLIIPVDYRNNDLLNQVLAEVDLQVLFLVQFHVVLDDEQHLQYDYLEDFIHYVMLS